MIRQIKRFVAIDASRLGSNGGIDARSEIPFKQMQNLAQSLASANLGCGSNWAPSWTSGLGGHWNPLDVSKANK